MPHTEQSSSEVLDSVSAYPLEGNRDIDTDNDRDSARSSCDNVGTPKVTHKKTSSSIST